LEWNL